MRNAKIKELQRVKGLEALEHLENTMRCLDDAGFYTTRKMLLLALYMLQDEVEQVG